jgi:predicted metal-dependent peptidase
VCKEKVDENSLDENKNQDSNSELDNQLFNEFTKSILEKEAKQDSLPSSIERFFDLEYMGKIDWKEELKYALDKFHKDDYRLIPPNKKFLHLGVYLPSSVSNKFRFAVAIDSSGSVSVELLNEFLNELNFIMQTIQNYQIELLICDDKIHSHKTFYSGDMLECELKGSGGTDFRPVFEFIDAKLPDIELLLYFSDLDGKFPDKEVNYEVKWVAPKEKEVPFGEMIILIPTKK